MAPDIVSLDDTGGRVRRAGILFYTASTSWAKWVSGNLRGWGRSLASETKSRVALSQWDSVPVPRTGTHPVQAPPSSSVFTGSGWTRLAAVVLTPALPQLPIVLKTPAPYLPWEQRESEGDVETPGSEIVFESKLVF